MNVPATQYGPACDGGPEPLDGFTVGVTAARRADELGTLLERRGARVVHAPAMRMVPLVDEGEVRQATERCLQRPPDMVIVTTGIGLRGWLDAAEGWGASTPLLDTLRKAQLLARGPKARGAVRAAGLPDAWSPESESSAELLQHLIASPDMPLEGARVAVQLHGQPLPGFLQGLRDAGADVVEVPVYRWTAPRDTTPLRNLLEAIRTRAVDAVTFTSAPAVASMLALAEERGIREELLDSLRGHVLAACVGPITYAPLADLDVPAVCPRRFRLGALVRQLSHAMPARAPTLAVAGHELQVRGHAAIVDGELKPLSPQARALLATLAERPGHVLTRQQLADTLNATLAEDRPLDEHAIEQAITRLRAALATPELVQTVIKRGYRLRTEPARETHR